MRGRLRAGPDDARRPSRPSTASPRSATPSWRRSWGRPPTTCPGVPGRRAEDGGASGSASTTASTTWSTHADEITGKAGESLREHLGDVIRNRQLNALVRDLDLELGAGRPRPSVLGPRTRCTPSSTAWSSGCCATASSRRWTSRGGDRRLRLRPRRPRGSARARSAAWLAEHARRPVAGSGSRCRAPGASGTGDVHSVALAAADGTAAWLDAGEVDPRRRRGAGGLARRPGRGPRCCTTPRARCSRWPPAAGRCAGWSATPRWRRTSSAPTSAPTTSPTSPCATCGAS